ncbi:MAG: FHA domain-containing protein [Propionibacteriales bacterium]|nr:FHA domain-containing protein [Propionibacteriales bacterium]
MTADVPEGLATLVADDGTVLAAVRIDGSVTHVQVVVRGIVLTLAPLGATPPGVSWQLQGRAPAAPVSEYTAVRRSPAPPAPPAPPTPPTPPPTPPQVMDLSPDHDGRTVTAAQLEAIRAAQARAAVPAAAPSGRPMVALSLSTGRVVLVRRRVLIGRSPRVQQVGGSANLPALVTLDDPYVSSTHLEVAADGTRVTVTDTSTNGTLLSRHGRAPVPLERGVATEIAVGDVLTLSKGLTATVVPAPEQAP